MLRARLFPVALPRAGVSWTGERRRFSRLDLPTFGRPTMATLGIDMARILCSSLRREKPGRNEHDLAAPTWQTSLNALLKEIAPGSDSGGDAEGSAISGGTSQGGRKLDGSEFGQPPASHLRTHSNLTYPFWPSPASVTERSWHGSFALGAPNSQSLAAGS